MRSLKACLEEIVRLGPGYIVNECGYEWEAGELLVRLEDSYPCELELPVFYLRPNHCGDGVIYEEGPCGEMTYRVPLYLVERLRVTVESPLVQ